MNLTRQEIIDLYESNVRGFSSLIRNSRKDILEYLNEKYPHLKNNNTATKMYWLIHDLKDYPICPVCNGKIYVGKNITRQAGYPKRCSVKCMNRDANHTQYTKDMFRELEQNPEKKNLIFKKRKQTNLERYGVENHMMSTEIKGKIKQTNLEKYGVENPVQSEKIQEKIKQTNLERYGHECAMQSSKIKEEIERKIKTKFGVKSVLELTEIQQSGLEARQQNNYNALNNEFAYPLFSLEEFNEHNLTDKTGFLFFKCKKCGQDYKSKYYDGKFQKCIYCFPKIQTSQKEHQIFEFLDFLNIEIKRNDRTLIHPLELDFFIPEKKIAIEFNGLYWHSEIQNNDKNYHLNKTNLCEEQDIHLIHIFENEWANNPEIVKSRLKNILGISDRKIYARECEVKEIDSQTSKKFLEENHIQRNVGSSIRLCLFYKDKLVSVMTFSKTRFSKKYEYEMLRFCNLINTSIVGGASRLLKYFEMKYKPKSLVSYADRRWSFRQNNVYQALNFRLTNISKPNYWYFKNSDTSILESRVKYQKHKLSKILENFNPEKTESQNMLDNGYNRIFDCGNLVYVKEY